MQTLAIRGDKLHEIRGVTITHFLYFCIFKKIIIMAGIKDLINSASYKAFMKKLLVYTLIVFGLGLVFMLCKWPGGNVMTQTGGSTLIVWMVLYIIGKIVNNNS